MSHRRGILGHVDEDRVVELRDERREDSTRHLRARIRSNGDLCIEGHDLGSGTALVSSDGEYEWFKTIRSEHIVQLRQVLGAEAGVDLLDFLQERFSGPASYDLEELLRTADIPIEFFSC
jgi:hypothetical protein